MADRYAGGELLAEVVRSGFVEGYHRGSVVVLDAAGKPAAAAGDVLGPVFPRSANKPMQAVGMLRAGFAPAEPADLALAAASHRGEPMHIQRVRAMLRTAGLTEDALACPPDLPLDPQARRDVLAAGAGEQRILMNCSGKHAAMLVTCLAAGWPTAGYRAPDHPLQVALRATVEELAGDHSGSPRGARRRRAGVVEEPIGGVGVDGCGAPVFALSLSGLAAAYLRLVDAPAGTPERTVADAMRACPELVSGTGADDAVLMRGLPGVLAKGGAEGVLAVAVPGVGAVAIKVDDGAMRPRMPVLAGALRRLGVDAAVLDQLAAHADGVEQRGGGEVVGTVRAVW
jgi:L-asparaginase II